jgi:arylsulfatase
MVAWSLGVSAKERPNIVFILADDMGYSDPGFMGSEIETPNLDRLAEGGTLCTHFMNHAKCEPSRASLMTGVHFHRQTQDHVTREFRQGTTMANELKKAGYFTITTGKWHLPGNPSLHGFERSFGLVSGAANHFDPDGRLKLDPKCYAHKEFALNGKPYAVTDDDFYSTDAFTDYALDFLEERPAKSPFFLYLAYTAPHWPLQAPEANIQKYAERYLEGWEHLRAERHENLLRIGMISKDWKKAPADPKVTSWSKWSEA